MSGEPKIIAFGRGGRPWRPVGRGVRGFKSALLDRFGPTWAARCGAAFGTVCDFRRNSFCMPGVGRQKDTIIASVIAGVTFNSQRYTTHSQPSHRRTICNVFCLNNASCAISLTYPRLPSCFRASRRPACKRNRDESRKPSRTRPGGARPMEG